MKRLVLSLFAVLAMSLTACDAFGSAFEFGFGGDGSSASAEMATSRYVGMVLTFHIDDVTGYPQIGDPDAPVQILQFSSFSCPHCANFHEDVFPGILEMIRNGDVNYVFIPFYIAGNIGDGEAAAEAMMCAAYQESAFSFSDLLFDAQVEYGSEAFTADRLGEMAESLGLDVNALQSCIDNDGSSLYEIPPQSLAEQYGVNSTPQVVILIEGVDPVVLVSPSIDQINQVILPALD